MRNSLISLISLVLGLAGAATKDQHSLAHSQHTIINPIVNSSSILVKGGRQVSDIQKDGKFLIRSF